MLWLGSICTVHNAFFILYRFWAQRVLVYTRANLALSLVYLHFHFLPFYYLILYSLVCFFIYIPNNNIQFHLRLRNKIHSHTYTLSRAHFSLVKIEEKKAKGTKTRAKWITHEPNDGERKKRAQSNVKKSLHTEHIENGKNWMYKHNGRKKLLSSRNFTSAEYAEKIKYMPCFPVRLVVIYALFCFFLFIVPMLSLSLTLFNSFHSTLFLWYFE